MQSPIALDLTPQKITHLQRKFRIGAEADVLASLSSAGADLMDAARARCIQARKPHEMTRSYWLSEGNWYSVPDDRKNVAQVAYPGADMQLGPLFQQLTLTDVALYGPHPDRTHLRITEDISPVGPNATQRVMLMHGDVRPEQWGDPEHAFDAVYLPQDRYEHMTAEWLRGYKGTRDRAYMHIRRNVLHRPRLSQPQQIDQGDAAYQRWYKHPRVQARLWRAPALSVVHARTGQPHAGRPHPGRPLMDDKPVWRVFPRVIVYRPRG